jgi:hypothetical protein
MRRRLTRVALQILAGVTLMGLTVNPSKANQSVANESERYDPVADPAAVVKLGHARFTVLTPEMIRMEWVADGKFEDHASIVFLNRKLPVPKFEQGSFQAGRGVGLTIRTSALTLHYATLIAGDKFTADNLSVTLHVDGKEITWKPFMPDTGNLSGTIDTLDGVRGSNIKLEPGLISRDGWVLVDDTNRPLFDSDDFSFAQGEKSPWPWVV